MKWSFQRNRLNKNFQMWSILLFVSCFMTYLFQCFDHNPFRKNSAENKNYRIVHWDFPLIFTISLSDLIKLSFQLHIENRKRSLNVISCLSQWKTRCVFSSKIVIGIVRNKTSPVYLLPCFITLAYSIFLKY